MSRWRSHKSSNKPLSEGCSIAGRISRTCLSTGLCWLGSGGTPLSGMTRSISVIASGLRDTTPDGPAVKEVRVPTSTFSVVYFSINVVEDRSLQG
jgi:hypothetical protein